MSWGRKVIFIDESGFHYSNLQRSKARSLAGERASITTQPKSKRVNVISALSEEGVVLNRYVIATQSRKNNNGGKGGTNAEDFRSFLMDLAPQIPRNSLLIIDNARIHYATLLENTVWLALKETWGIDKLFLPPYSPFLNPIEFVFNTVKQRMASASETCSNIRAFKTKIEETFATITAEEAKKYFAHCQKYYAQCKACIPFTGTILSPDLAPEAE